MGKIMKQKLDLRKGVDFIGVTCVFYCHDGKGNLLMHKRSENCRDEVGRWDPGAGSMEFGETFLETVTREIREEYCVTPRNIKFWSVSNVLRKNGKTKTHWIAILVTAKVDPKKCKIGEPSKMDEIGWFSVDKLPSPLHSMVRKHLRMIRDNGAKI
jgi:ADP-ribose pyrophosphatase YjhB (NUDIX family)